MPGVVYEFKFRSPATVEQHILMKSEIKVLSKMPGTKQEEVTEYWRKFHIEEVHNFGSSPNIIRTVKPRRKKWFSK
jgi:hypothetical protein